ncbi:lipase [Trametes meyenii]|nr:lipase [Trametes meyenii]
MNPLSLLKVLTVLFLTSIARAAATSSATEAQTITTLSDAQIAAFLPYTHYAAVGYCPPSITLAWSCGANCAGAHPGFKPIAAGGDGDATQFWFAGFDPAVQEVIVSHQGTNFSEFLPVLEDISILLEPLDTVLFPGLPSTVLVHSGFSSHQSKTALDILQAVQTGVSKFGAKQVTVSAHSLGASLGLLDAIFLHLHLPNVAVRFIGYALPRVGNQAFANFVDGSSVSVTHINNMEDLVPILPGRFLGYHHPSGEIHIQDSGHWVACPGQDNTSDQCIVGDVPTIFQGNPANHNGPYQEIEMGEC